MFIVPSGGVAASLFCTEQETIRLRVHAHCTQHFESLIKYTGKTWSTVQSYRVIDYSLLILQKLGI